MPADLMDMLLNFLWSFFLPPITVMLLLASALLLSALPEFFCLLICADRRFLRLTLLSGAARTGCCCCCRAPSGDSFEGLSSSPDSEELEDSEGVTGGRGRSAPRLPGAEECWGPTRTQSSGTGLGSRGGEEEVGAVSCSSPQM